MRYSVMHKNSDPREEFLKQHFFTKLSYYEKCMQEYKASATDLKNPVNFNQKIQALLMENYRKKAELDALVGTRK